MLNSSGRCRSVRSSCVALSPAEGDVQQGYQFLFVPQLSWRKSAWSAFWSFFCTKKACLESKQDIAELKSVQILRRPT